ncbi:hypothetical protein ATK36_4551 [Amycolatopsis sulphurea]|uniref:Uncharacterized protein n=1 Tax=Amycolatopsis sulphurea TaxID=76022 RepID=A0A2A9FE19_9PSEU|nr:hypothetical protein [Amycolatopsis sulphurea]PFG49398.1 hypothetical protein ATK36_4551 [Amycolatopsis sulphurea]
MTDPQQPHGQYPYSGQPASGAQPYPGSQPTPAQSYPDSQPMPAQSYPDSQPTPAQSYPDSQPMPAQSFPGSQPMPGQPFPGSQPTPSQPYSGNHPMPAQPYPGGQPVPGQPYPGSQPMAPQPYPGAQFYGQMPGPYPQQQYPPYPGVMQPRPNGATAIIAGVLAAVGGAAALFGAIGGAVLLGHRGGLGYGLLALIVNLALAVLLIFGATTLFLHKPAGRLCVIAGCGLAIAYSITSAVLVSAGVSSLRGGSELIGFGIAGALVALIPPVATLVLALVKPTVDWVSQPGSGGYPQQPGW